MTTTHPRSRPPPCTQSPTATAAPVERSDDIAALPAALRSEWIKIRSLRSTPGLLAAVVVIGVLLSWILATFVKTDPDTHLPFTIGETFVFSTWLTMVLAIVMGALSITSEVQHGTLATAVTTQPARWVIVAAKAVVGSGLGLAMGIIGMAAGLGGAVLGGLEAGDTSGSLATAGWGLAAHHARTDARPRDRHDRPPQRRRHHRRARLGTRHREPHQGLRTGERHPVHALQRRRRPARHQDRRRQRRDAGRRPHPTSRTRSSSPATSSSPSRSAPRCSTAGTPTERPRSKTSAPADTSPEGTLMISTTVPAADLASGLATRDPELAALRQLAARHPTPRHRQRARQRRQPDVRRQLVLDRLHRPDARRHRPLPMHDPALRSSRLQLRRIPPPAVPAVRVRHAERTTPAPTRSESTSPPQLSERNRLTVAFRLVLIIPVVVYTVARRGRCVPRGDRRCRSR